jgi:hypothetical protein
VTLGSSKMFSYCNHPEFYCRLHINTYHAKAWAPTYSGMSSLIN